MRRVLACAVATLVLHAAAPPARAKFGLTKTRITLARERPPDLALSGRTVAVDAASDSRAVTRSHLSAIRGEVESALRGEALFELVASPAEADSVVRVTVDELVARVRESVTYEERSVKVGERREWDDRKKKMVTRDVYERRKEPVTLRRVTGHLAGRVEVETPEGKLDGVEVLVPYEEEFKGDHDGPAEASSEEALERHLVAMAGDRAAAAVTTSPDPVSVLLAVDGPLKDGNRMAESGQFEAAVDAWSRPLKGDQEAARLHNLGVAQEALAYKLPSHAEGHRSGLERAQELYRQAQALDPGEKYFGEPIERIALSLDYAEGAQRILAALERSRAAGGRVRAAHRVGNERARPEAPSAGASVLRNGSFDASLGPWVLGGRGGLQTEGSRGRVLELAGSTAPAEVGQALDTTVAAGATVSLEYRVVSGEPPIRVVVEYEDGEGRPRVSTIEVSAGESPGPWSGWDADLGTLRPRPARLLHLRLLVEGGTVRLDNVGLTAE